MRDIISVLRDCDEGIFRTSSFGDLALPSCSFLPEEASVGPVQGISHVFLLDASLHHARTRRVVRPFESKISGGWAGRGARCGSFGCRTPGAFT